MVVLVASIFLFIVSQNVRIFNEQNDKIIGSDERNIENNNEVSVTKIRENFARYRLLMCLKSDYLDRLQKLDLINNSSLLNITSRNIEGPNLFKGIDFF